MLQVKIILGSLLVFTFVAWFVFGKGGSYETYQLRKIKSEQESDLVLLSARKQKVMDYLDKLKRGDELAMETAARRYGLVGANEVIYETKVEPKPVETK